MVYYLLTNNYITVKINNVYINNQFHDAYIMELLEVMVIHDV
jgi:hypothetical protein